MDVHVSELTVVLQAEADASRCRSRRIRQPRWCRRAPNIALRQAFGRGNIRQALEHWWRGVGPSPGPRQSHDGCLAWGDRCRHAAAGGSRAGM